MATSQAPRPAFSGLLVHYDATFDFTVLVPDGWSRLNLAGSEGVLYAPDAAEPLTGIAVEGRELGTQVQPGDLGPLRRGFWRGLRKLADCRIESREAVAVGPLISLEARHTFRDGSEVRKRWLRLLYQGTTQLRLMAQAASPEAFAYWEPMFYTAIRTAQFGRI